MSTKRYLEMLKKESKEHPTLSRKTVSIIVRDHIKSEIKKYRKKNK